MYWYDVFGGQQVVQDVEDVFFVFVGVLGVVCDDYFFVEVDQDKGVGVGVVYCWVGFE